MTLIRERVGNRKPPREPNPATMPEQINPRLVDTTLTPSQFVAEAPSLLPPSNPAR
jgi:hypothetical protein